MLAKETKCVDYVLEYEWYDNRDVFACGFPHGWIKNLSKIKAKNEEEAVRFAKEFVGSRKLRSVNLIRTIKIIGIDLKEIE